MKKQIVSLVCACTLVLALFSGCGGSASSTAAARAADTEPQAYAMDEGAGWDTTAAETSEVASGTENGSATLLPQDARKVILHASLSLEALDFTATCNTLLETLEQAGGYVASTSVDTPAYEGALRSAYYTFRVPAEGYSAFLRGAGGAGNLVSKQENTEDVTSAYVDVEARLKSLRLQEERLFAMMEQAGDLETLLAIQNQLTDVQYEIESYTAQQRTYDNLISYSTVDVTVEEVRHITEKTDTFGDRISEAFTGGWREFGYGVQDLAVWFVGALPVLVVLAALAAVLIPLCRAAAKRRRQRLASRPAPQPADYTLYAPQRSGTADGSAPAPAGEQAPQPPAKPKYQK